KVRGRPTRYGTEKRGLSRLALLDEYRTSITTSTTIPTTVDVIPAPSAPAGRARARCRPGRETMSPNGAPVHWHRAVEDFAPVPGLQASPAPFGPIRPRI